MTPKAFSAKLKRVINRASALDLIEGDWGQGGCWILAVALTRVLPGKSELYAITHEGRVQHVVVKYQGLYIDRDGAQTEDELFEHARQDLTPEPFYLEKLSEDLRAQAEDGGVPCDPVAVRKLVIMLKRTFP